MTKKMRRRKRARHAVKRANALLLIGATATATMLVAGSSTSAMAENTADTSGVVADAPVSDGSTPEIGISELEVSDASVPETGSDRGVTDEVTPTDETVTADNASNVDGLGGTSVEEVAPVSELGGSDAGSVDTGVTDVTDTGVGAEGGVAETQPTEGVSEEVAPSEGYQPDTAAPVDGEQPVDGTSPSDGSTPVEVQPTDGSTPTEGEQPVDGGQPADGSSTTAGTDELGGEETTQLDSNANYLYSALGGTVVKVGEHTFHPFDDSNVGDIEFSESLPVIVETPDTFTGTYKTYYTGVEFDGDLPLKTGLLSLVFESNGVSTSEVPIALTNYVPTPVETPTEETPTDTGSTEGGSETGSTEETPAQPTEEVPAQPTYPAEETPTTPVEQPEQPVEQPEQPVEPTTPTDSVDSTESTDSTTSTDSTESTDSQSSEGIQDSTQSTDSADSTVSTDSTGSTDSTESTDSTDLTDSVDSTESTDSTDSVDSTESTDSTDSTESTNSTDTDSIESTDSTTSVDSTDSTDSTSTSEDNNTSEAPVDSNDNSEGIVTPPVDTGGSTNTGGTVVTPPIDNGGTVVTPTVDNGGSGSNTGGSTDTGGGTIITPPTDTVITPPTDTVVTPPTDTTVGSNAGNLGTVDGSSGTNTGSSDTVVTPPTDSTNSGTVIVDTGGSTNTNNGNTNTDNSNIDVSGVSDKANYTESPDTIKVSVKTGDVADVTATVSSADGTQTLTGRIVNGEFVADNLPTEDGVYTVKVEVTDSQGNTTERTITYAVNKNGSTYDWLSDEANGAYYQRLTEDLKLSEHSTTQLDASKTKFTFTLNGQVVTLDSSKVQIKEMKEEDGSYTYVYTFDKGLFKDNGVWSISVATVDVEGHSSSSNASVKFQFVIDSVAPVVSIEGIQSNTEYNSATHDVRIVISDNIGLAKVKVIINGKTYEFTKEELERGEKLITLERSSTPYKIEVVATDYAGNETTETATGIRVTSSVIESLAVAPSFSSLRYFLGGLAGIGFAGLIAWWVSAVRKRKRKRAEVEADAIAISKATLESASMTASSGTPSREELTAVTGADLSQELPVFNASGSVENTSGTSGTAGSDDLSIDTVGMASVGVAGVEETATATEVLGEDGWEDGEALTDVLEGTQTSVMEGTETELVDEATQTDVLVEDGEDVTSVLVEEEGADVTEVLPEGE